MRGFLDFCIELNLQWTVSFLMFLVTVALALLFTVLKHEKKRIVNPTTAYFIGTFFSSVVYFLPRYWYEPDMTGLSAVAASVQHALRLFTLEGDFFERIVNCTVYPEEIKGFYITFGAILYTFAPILTFTFILSFFKNLSAHLKYSCLFWTKAHVFSELNRKSLALAADIEKNSKPFLGFIPRTVVAFTDIVDKKEEMSLELIDGANELGAILFRKDMDYVCFKRKWSLRRVNFYLISEDEPEKIRHAESIVKKYDCKRVNLRVFSDDIRTELMLAANNPAKMEIERVNDIRALIYHELYENGHNIFRRARKVQNKDKREKIISIVIVGLGKYGTEMLKAVTWFCQLTGYVLKINVFDTDKKAKEKFEAMCPELMSPDYNKQRKEGEPYYEIDIHSGIDVEVPEFEKKIRSIKDATFFFVSLGNDSTNLATSCKIREITETVDYNCDVFEDGYKPPENYKPDTHKPDIETVIYSTNLCESMRVTWNDVFNWQKAVDDNNISERDRNKAHSSGVKNFKSQPYNILMIGDLESFYSEETVLASTLVEAGFEAHLRYSIDPKKIAFTENLMQKEWIDFINSEGLDGIWAEHTKEIKKELSLSEMKKGFKFMNKEELAVEQKQKNKEKLTEKEEQLLKDLSDNVAKRTDIWETKVFRRFNELCGIDAPALPGEAAEEKKPPEKSIGEKFREWNFKRKFVSDWKKTVIGIKKDEIRNFRIEYNYLSSISKALHAKLKKDLGFELMDREWEYLTQEEKYRRGSVEHIRWNAYMRTCGYGYSDQRNDLGKRHYNLVPTKKLDYETLRKDA